MSIKYFVFVYVILAAFGCAKKEDFENIDLHVAGPIDVQSSKDGKYFYVLNSDFDRSYNTGSILVIDENGKKINSVQVPRLGRSMNIAGNDMIVTFSKGDDDQHNEVHLYDLSKDPTNPQLTARWTDEDEKLKLDCVPINSAIRENFDYFFVTCMGGRIFLGNLKSPRTASTLKLVREASDGGRARRAIHIDVRRMLAFFFPTDYDEQKSTDNLTKDAKTYDQITGKELSNKPNEIPDDMENSRYKIKNSARLRSRYQFVLYDIASEKEKGFPFRDIDDEEDSVASKELRWIYYTLSNLGTPDTDTGKKGSEDKHYHTNFWATQPDPTDVNSFFISQRGKRSKAAQYANNVIRVTLNDAIMNMDDLPTTEEAMTFTRVYGFKGQVDTDRHFPGDFKVQYVNGQLTMVVNHFKDLVNFRKDSAFSIAAQIMNPANNFEPDWDDEVKSTNQYSSFYQVAMNERGKVLSCSFYSNAVIPLELSPGTAINLGWDNIKRIE